MRNAEQYAKELLKTANVVKQFSGIGSLTIEGTLEDFKNAIDDFDKFLETIDKAGYCLKPRQETYLGIFPADNDENIVLIEK